MADKDNPNPQAIVKVTWADAGILLIALASSPFRSFFGLLAGAANLVFESVVSDVLSVRRTKADPRPARMLRFLARAATKWDENLTGDLQERFVEVDEDLGPWYAQAWYFCQVVRLAWPALRTVWEWVVKAGVVAWVARGCK